MTSSKSDASSLVGFGVDGWFAAKHSPPLGYVIRHIVLAFTRPRVSIRVTGLGFEPFAVCGFPTRALAFARCHNSFTTKPYHMCGMA